MNPKFIIGVEKTVGLRYMDYEVECIKTRDRPHITWKEVADGILRSLHLKRKTQWFSKWQRFINYDLTDD